MKLELAYVRRSRNRLPAGLSSALRVVPIFKAEWRYVRHCLNQLVGKKVCWWWRVCV
jgi:hypothetical protein